MYYKKSGFPYGRNFWDQQNNEIIIIFIIKPTWVSGIFGVKASKSDIRSFVERSIESATAYYLHYNLCRAYRR